MVEINQNSYMDEIKNKERIVEIDMAKGILILLVVVFHLGFFNTHYPYVGQIRQAITMPGFMLISGYLFSVNKEPRRFMKGLYGIVVPYCVFEIVYLLGVGALGDFLDASNTFDGGALALLGKVAFSPSGTYWYLHSLAICMIVYYIVNRYVVKGLSSILISAVILYALSIGITGLR